MEPLINLYPKTAEEKLLFAESFIAELKEENKRLAMENGYLESEMAELRHEMKSDTVGALMLKRDNQAEQINNLRAKLRKTELDGERLLQKVIQYQLKG